MNAQAIVNASSPITAMWRNHLLMPPGKTLSIASSGIWDGTFNYTRETDAEQQETTEAQNPIDLKGGDKAKSFSLQVVANKYAMGVDPLSVYSNWIKALGKSAPFFVGLLPIDKSNYILKTVELDFTNQDIAANGSPFRVDITLSFEEDIVLNVKKKNGTEEKTTEKTTKKTAANTGPTKAAKDAEIKQWQKELFG